MCNSCTQRQPQPLGGHRQAWCRPRPDLGSLASMAPEGPQSPVVLSAGQKEMGVGLGPWSSGSFAMEGRGRGKLGALCGHNGMSRHPPTWQSWGPAPSPLVLQPVAWPVSNETARPGDQYEETNCAGENESGRGPGGFLGKGARMGPWSPSGEHLPRAWAPTLGEGDSMKQATRRAGPAFWELPCWSRGRPLRVEPGEASGGGGPTPRHLQPSGEESPPQAQPSSGSSLFLTS